MQLISQTFNSVHSNYTACFQCQQIFSFVFCQLNYYEKEYLTHFQVVYLVLIMNVTFKSGHCTIHCHHHYCHRPQHFSLWRSQQFWSPNFFVFEWKKHILTAVQNIVTWVLHLMHCFQTWNITFLWHSHVYWTSKDFHFVFALHAHYYYYYGNK